MSKQQINELKNLIEVLFLGAISGKLENKHIPICKLSPQGRKALENLSGLTFKEDISFCIHPSDLRHIYRKHYLKNEKATNDLSPLSINDIRNIVDVLMHPDEILFLGVDSHGKKFALFLENENGCYTIIEVYAHKKGNLTAKTFYNARNKTGLQRMIINNAHAKNQSDIKIMTADIPILICSFVGDKPDAIDGLDTPSHTSETVPGK